MLSTGICSHLFLLKLSSRYLLISFAWIQVLKWIKAPLLPRQNVQLHCDLSIYCAVQPDHRPRCGDTLICKLQISNIGRSSANFQIRMRNNSQTCTNGRDLGHAADESSSAILTDGNNAEFILWKYHCFRTDKLTNMYLLFLIRLERQISFCSPCWSQ